MQAFVGELSTLDGTPIGEAHGQYGPEGGRFTLPVGHEGDVRPGLDYLLDIEGGPYLKIFIDGLEPSGHSPTVVRFSIQGPPLPRPTSPP